MTTISLTTTQTHDLLFAIQLAQDVVVQLDAYSSRPNKLAEYLQNLDIIKEKLNT